MWKLIAWIVSRPRIADYLIERSKRTPYFDLPGYMERWWLFNPYGNREGSTDAAETTRHKAKYSWLPSIRIHHILRADVARDLHDHPWDARTIILKGDYVERRRVGMRSTSKSGEKIEPITEEFLRLPGDTATIKFGEYHSIDYVSDGGVYTMFFTWDYRGTWGFLVNGKKVPWREYENGGAA